MRALTSPIALLLLTACVGTTPAVDDAELGAVDASDAVIDVAVDDSVEEVAEETEETLSEPEEEVPVVPVVVVVDPDPVVLGSNAQKKGAINFDATYDNIGDTVTILTKFDATEVLERNSGNDFSSIFGYASATNDIVGFRAISGSGQSVFVVAGGEDSGGVLGIQTIRSGDILMPLVGSATFTGDYIAVQNFGSDIDPGTAITGNASLNIDFADATVSGMITDRISRSLSSLWSVDDGKTLSDVTLSETALGADGVFDGTVSGVSAVEVHGRNTDNFSGSGSYGGMVSGPNGNETVGHVSIDWVLDGTSVTGTETGGFLATTD